MELLMENSWGCENGIMEVQKASAIFLAIELGGISPEI